MEQYSQNHNTKRRLPAWLKRPVPKGEKFENVVNVLNTLQLPTVCSSASCPNRGECYSHGTATFMIMGDVCTRNCEFCGVHHGDVEPLATDEPERLAEAVKELKLKHVVITSVTRDDLPDKGAEHFAAVIRAVRKESSTVTIEVLTPDFMGEITLLDIVHNAQPDVFNHNLETCRRLTPEIRSGADYDRSLGILQYMSQQQNAVIVKSGFMVGLGETGAEIKDMLCDLKTVGVQMLTIGQYLRPGKENRAVQRFYTPEEFEQIKNDAESMGFRYVAAGPFVRSSYYAESSLTESEQPK